VWVATRPVPVPPSPNFHEYEYGRIPPDATPENVRGTPARGVKGRYVKLAESLFGPKMSLIVGAEEA
jgi:hypothetical protein